jgi:hypothetical protein
VRFKQGTLDDVAIVTTDLGIRLVAQDETIAAIKVPDNEKWRQPPESNDDQKEIQKLRKRIEELESNFASVKVSFQPEGPGFPFGVYRELTRNEIEEIIGWAKKARAPYLNDPNRSLILWGLPQDRIDEYNNCELPNWLKRIDGFLQQLPRSLNFLERTMPITLKVECTGIRPADYLTLEIRVKGESCCELHRRATAKRSTATCSFLLRQSLCQILF